MSAEIDRPTPFAAYGLPGVFLGVLACLLVLTFGPDELTFALESYGAGAAALAPLVILVCSVGLLVRARFSHERAARLRREASLVPCMVAPIAALAPWTVAPSHLGVALGGLPFFQEWLFRYPSHGPINLEVLLGMGAMLGACAMPAFFAVYATITRRPRAAIVALFVLLQLVAYVPVLLRLDLGLVYCSIFVPIDHAGSLLTAAPIAAGPILRSMATAAMIAAVPLSLRRAPEPIWET